MRIHPRSYERTPAHACTRICARAQACTDGRASTHENARGHARALAYTHINIDKAHTGRGGHVYTRVHLFAQVDGCMRALTLICFCVHISTSGGGGIYIPAHKHTCAHGRTHACVHLKHTLMRTPMQTVGHVYMWVYNSCTRMPINIHVHEHAHTP